MYAIVDDTTPSRANALYVGTAEEVIDVWDSLPEYNESEQCKIVEVEDAKRGDRVWHSGVWVQPDSLR
jgi:hypothetical protein